MYAEGLPWTISILTLTLIAQAVFLLDYRQTDRCTWTPTLSPRILADVGNEGEHSAITQPPVAYNTENRELCCYKLTAVYICIHVFNRSQWSGACIAHSPIGPAFVSCSDDFRARFWYRKAELEWSRVYLTAFTVLVRVVFVKRIYETVSTILKLCVFISTTGV